MTGMAILSTLALGLIVTVILSRGAALGPDVVGLLHALAGYIFGLAAFGAGFVTVDDVRVKPILARALGETLKGGDS